LKRSQVEIERFALREAFTISRGAKTEAVVAVVRIEEDGVIARGESTPYARYGESAERVRDTIAALLPRIDAGMSRDELQRAIGPGAARNAIDLALWDLEAKRAGKRAWELLGVEVRAIETAYTLPIVDLEETRALAKREADRPLLKVKLGRDDDLARLTAIREETPARLIVDPNEGWDLATLEEMSPALAALGVELIEQPLPASDDEALEGFRGPVPICADESFHGDVDRARSRYGAVNVKLDKTGGLTTALETIARARDAGLSVMIGSMVASSLAVAPAMILAQHARWADLDAALFLAHDREPGLRYERSTLHPPPRDLWG
jgi:L-alanine-DL-glutamate epimerase-like enolase superfamily enzyme